MLLYQITPILPYCIQHIKNKIHDIWSNWLYHKQQTDIKKDTPNNSFHGKQFWKPKVLLETSFSTGIFFPDFLCKNFQIPWHSLTFHDPLLRKRYFLPWLSRPYEPWVKIKFSVSKKKSFANGKPLHRERLSRGETLAFSRFLPIFAKVYPLEIKVVLNSRKLVACEMTKFGKVSLPNKLSAVFFWLKCILVQIQESN